MIKWKKSLFLFALLLMLILPGCTVQQTQNMPSRREEQPHLYWKDIDVVVTDIDKKQWYASTHWYEVKVSVESEEYQLTYTEIFKGSGAFGCPPQWEYDEGDTVRAELYSWVMDSTGEVIRREIHMVY